MCQFTGAIDLFLHQLVNKRIQDGTVGPGGTGGIENTMG